MKSSGMDITALQDSLNYLYVSELRNRCETLCLSNKGKKAILVSRIIHFVETGEKTELPAYPSISCAKGKHHPDLEPECLMLKGAYKNDLKTRKFFKKLIGDHFHFTAFGIDWLEDRWMDGNPPTYHEFAEMFKYEHEFRKANGSAPKEEWAYINFVKAYLKNNPNAGSKEILQEWNLKRNQHKKIVEEFFAEVL
jgi:hypothetical protein